MGVTAYTSQRDAMEYIPASLKACAGWHSIVWYKLFSSVARLGIGFLLNKYGNFADASVDLLAKSFGSRGLEHV